MATTRIIPMHTGKGKTIAQCLSDRTGYGMNPEKTNGGELIITYACDPHTADAEFLLAKREYMQLTGREQKSDVIAYQIRQSFKPGEITPEEAQKVGYEFASRFLKGKHAFIVCTHTDKKHIHNHIYWSAVTLDCKHKFRDFRGSWRAVAKLSDIICIAHQLSVVQEPKRYTHSHYGKWLGNRAKLSNREQLRVAIDEALAKHPHTFDAFLELMQQSGYRIKPGKHITFCMDGQKNIRMDSLQAGYTEEEIRAVISGGKKHTPRKKRDRSVAPKIQQVLDMDAIRAANKGLAYERWATNFNTNAASKSLWYMQTYCGGSYERLSQASDTAVERCCELSAQLDTMQTRLTEIAMLKQHIINYSRTRQVFQEYKAAGYSKKFLKEHQQEIEDHRAAKRVFNELGLKKLPTVKSLNEEYSQVLAAKKSVYAQLRTAEAERRELLIHRENLRPILSPEEKPRGKRKEQDER